MEGYIRFADDLSAWFGKVFAWCIIVMAFGIGYEVVVRYAFSAPTPWAFDLSYMLYGTLFMMAGAYTLSRDGHVRGDFIYRLWQPQDAGGRRTRALLPVFLSRRAGAGLRRLEICGALLALSGGEFQQPRRNPDLPVQVGHRRGRHPALPAGHRAGVPLHHLPAYGRMAARTTSDVEETRKGPDGGANASTCSSTVRRQSTFRPATSRRTTRGTTTNERSPNCRRHAPDPYPGDLPRVSRRLHAHGARASPSATTPISTPAACGAATSARSNPAPIAGR